MDTNKLLELVKTREDNNTVILTFADHRYTEVLLNWLIGLNRLGITNYIVVSLDEEIHGFLSERGFPSFLSPWEGTLSDLWALRVKIFHTLCAHEIDFIHSDTDAIWLTNPIPEYFNAADHHIISSSGTVWPPDVVKTQGFVFCCGLFYMKGCAQTLALMEEICSDVAVSGDDQVSFNKAIQRRQIIWDTSHRHPYTLTYDGQRFLCFKDMIFGQSRDQQFKVALLPHHLFQRLHMPGHDAYVKHLLSDKVSENKLNMLEKTECRFIKKTWQATQFNEISIHEIDTNDRHDSLKTLCMVLGPYRNLTTLTAAIVSLHPHCQVLNHAGETILSEPRLNFLDGYSDCKFNKFIDFALSQSAEGSPGDAGGSIMHSHAYDSHHQLKSLCEERYGKKRAKENIHCLFWKESLLVSQFIKESGVDIDELILHNDKLRFLLPIRNPLDCAISNLKTGHASRFNSPDQSKEGILNAILNEIQWFVQMADRQPGRFFYFLQNDFNEETLLRLSEFLAIDKEPKWIADALTAYAIKSTYQHDDAFIEFFRNRVSTMFSASPRLRDKLLEFLPGNTARTELTSAPAIMKRKKLKVLVYGLQSSGASLFSYFLSQRPETLGIIDLNNHRLAPSLPMEHDIILKAVVTTRWPLQAHIDSFQPDRTILFIRNPYNNYYSLQDKVYANKSGSIDEKFRLMEDYFIQQQRFDSTICYEDFIANPVDTLEILNTIDWYMTPEYYKFPRSPQEIAQFNITHNEWCRLNPAAAGPTGGWGMGNIRSSTIDLCLSDKPYDEKTHNRVKQLCPTLYEYYHNNCGIIVQA